MVVVKDRSELKARGMMAELCREIHEEVVLVDDGEYGRRRWLFEESA